MRSLYSVGMNKVGKVRRTLDMSQQRLANLAGVSISLVQKIEHGVHENVTLETARSLARALDTTVEELFPNGGGR